MFADDLETAQALLALIPPKPTFITVHEALYRDELEKRFGFTRLNPCWQMGWLRTTPPPLPDAANIRQLDQSPLPTVLANYTLTDQEYLSWLIAHGELYGAFDGGTLMAFIGRHAEGSVGLLEVLPPTAAGDWPPCSSPT